MLNTPPIMKNGEFHNGVKRAGVPFFFLSGSAQTNKNLQKIYPSPAPAKSGNPVPLNTCNKKKEKKSQKGKIKNIHFQLQIREIRKKRKSHEEGLPPRKYRKVYFLSRGYTCAVLPEPV
jgi:hypothetical protein